MWGKKRSAMELYNFSGTSDFNRLFSWSSRSQCFTHQQEKHNGKSVKKSSPNVKTTPFGNHCLKGSVCLDLSVWPRSFQDHCQDHPSPIPKVFGQTSPCFLGSIPFTFQRRIYQLDQAKSVVVNFFKAQRITKRWTTIKIRDCFVACVQGCFEGFYDGFQPPPTCLAGV